MFEEVQVRVMNLLGRAMPFHRWVMQPNNKTEVGGYRYLTMVGVQLIEVVPDFVRTPEGMRVVYHVRVDDEIINAAFLDELVAVVTDEVEAMQMGPLGYSLAHASH